MEGDESQTGSEWPKFNTPEEEIAYLKSKIIEHKHVSLERGERRPTEDIASEKVAEYRAAPPERVLAPEFKAKEPSHERLLEFGLKPEAHDNDMDTLLDILTAEGVKNTFNAVARYGNAHLEDDLHRVLVQYLKKYLAIPGMAREESVFKSLEMRLYELTLPNLHAVSDEKSQFTELASTMEQLYAGLLSIAENTRLRESGKAYFALEAAVSTFSDEIAFYAAVPETHAALFEKQIHALFPDVIVTESKEDYNIFNANGAEAGSYGRLARYQFYPIKTHEEFKQDPFAVILNAFSRIAWDNEGAALQLIISPAGTFYLDKYRRALAEIQRGVLVSEAAKLPDTLAGELAVGLKKVVFGIKPKEEVQYLETETNAVELISDKMGGPILETNIRLVASAPDHGRAGLILRDLEAAFNQFERAGSNTIVFTEIQVSKLRAFVKDFVYRTFSRGNIVPLNTKELASIFHFLAEGTNVPQVKQSVAKKAPAPVASGVPTDAGTLDASVSLGTNEYQGKKTPIRMKREDRMRHFYVIGQTGTGKSTMLKNMVRQDIANGEGVCMIDPHGEDLDDVLSTVPNSRLDDVIYFDPSYTARPMALNMLEYDSNYPEQKTFVANEMMSIFNKLFDMKVAGGPMFEQYFRNAVLLAIDDPNEGATLLEVSRVLANAAYREARLRACKNPVVIQFWREVAGKAGGEASLANIVPYITSKFDVFLTNEIMRPIVSQPKSVFNFRKIMDEKKVLLVNLSKGRLGDINANLLGLIIVGKILMAALSRVDSPKETRHDFFLYIDEFQNVTTDSIATILSEARKYRLGLTVAHQYIAQLEESIRDAVFGNVGSMAVFRVSSDDATYLESRFAPIFNASDIMKIENRNAYISMLMDGQPVKPFNVLVDPPDSPGTAERIAEIKKMSYLKYGVDRAIIEESILRRYEEMKAKTMPPSAPVSAPPPSPPLTPPRPQMAVPQPSASPAQSNPPSLPPLPPIPPVPPSATPPSPPQQ
ncbi:type IV secretory system conjugative DNA transfer family protein [bacterium]|nr:type IV secretory system conjugative DNA transfer family protein [bacterium]MCI0680256.1 type IV secretory system conjugative DNA transfer family protein [bacterium]